MYLKSDSLRKARIIPDLKMNKLKTFALILKKIAEPHATNSVSLSQTHKITHQ